MATDSKTLWRVGKPLDLNLHALALLMSKSCEV